MLLMIDNYDSFTYNLVQYFSELGQEVVVERNDKISLEENVNRLKMEIFELTHDVKFKSCKTMGDILFLTLGFVKRNYENVTMSEIITHKIK